MLYRLVCNIRFYFNELILVRRSRLHVFFKIAVLKSFAILLTKHLCYTVLLIKLQAWRPAFPIKRRLRHWCFSENIAKILRAAILLNTSCSLHFSEILCGNRILWTSLGTKLTFFIFLVPWLCFPLELSRVRLWCLRLFRTCFHAKICSKCNFSSHCNVHSSTILTESLKFWNNFRITVNSRSSLLQKLNMSFLYIILCYHFSLG